MDQLERGTSLPAARIAAITKSLNAAEMRMSVRVM